MSQNYYSRSNLIQRPIQPSDQIPFLAPIPSENAEFNNNLYNSYLQSGGIPRPHIRFPDGMEARPNTPPQPTNNQRIWFEEFIALVPEHLQGPVLAQASEFPDTRITIETVTQFLRTINQCNLSSTTQCSVCFADVDPSDVFTTSCNHSFCLKCIATWVFTKVQQQMVARDTYVECSCPYCRDVFICHRF